MADTEQQTTQEDKPKKFSIKTMILIPIGIVGLAVLLGSSGYGMGKFLNEILANPRPTRSVEDMNALAEETPPSKPDSDKQDGWYYDLEPVVANLDEPGATRYVRATVTLEMSHDLDQDKGTKLIQEKTPHLRNWLVIYLSGLTLDDARGEKNLKRIQAQILDAFNETLFPDSQPHVKRVLFKEGFAIQ